MAAITDVHIRLDAVDRRLVGELQADARLSMAERGRRVGLSAPAVADRVARLERDGVITGYRAEVSPDAVGLPLAAFLSVKPIDAEAPDDAPERLRHLSAVEACHSVAGEESYILQVRVAGPGELEQLLQEIRAAAGVSTRTTVVLSTPWEGRTARIARDA